MQRLEVSCAVRHIYKSLGAKGLNERTKIIIQLTVCRQFPTVLSVPTHSLTHPVIGCSYTFSFDIKSDDTNRPEEQ